MSSYFSSDLRCKEVDLQRDEINKGGEGMLEIGNVPWSRSDMRMLLAEFVKVYEKRPISHNGGGMLSTHMFLAYFILKTLNPKVIVESGVFKGQGTWLFEQACPNAELHCIDLDLNNLQYRSVRAKYYDRDFSMIDWGHLPKKETVLFFDDHQDAYQRIVTAKWFGFEHLIFEDNYPPGQGDCYSLKKVWAHSGHEFKFRPSSRKAMFKEKLEALIDGHVKVPGKVLPNSLDAAYLKRNCEIYCELPPLFKVSQSPFGDSWDDKYPTPEPLLSWVEAPDQQILLDEASCYNWMCYVKLSQAELARSC